MSPSPNWKKSLVFLIICLAMTIIQACGNENSSQEEADADAVSEQEYPTTVTIGTASQGGAFYLIGGGLSNLLEPHLNVSSNIEATGGPIHNLQLIENGDAELGMVTTGPLEEALSGEGEWLEEPYDNIRVVFPMYYTPFHWWAIEGSGVTSLNDVKSQRVGVGPAGGTSGTYSPKIHEILELETQDVQAGISDLGSQMLDGQLDIISFAGGLPTPAATEIEAQAKINFFGIDGKYRERVMDEMKAFDKYTIESGTYETQTEDIETIAMYNFGIVHKNVNEDFVYDLVKAYHENIDSMISTHSALVESKEPDAILKNKQYPMHPGAIRYYEEIGIELPEEVYPEK